MGPLTQHVEGFHQDTRHFLTRPSCQAPTQIMPTSLEIRLTTGPGSHTGWEEEEEKRILLGLFGQQFRVSRWVLVGINQGQFQYFSEIIKSESVGLRAMVGAQSGLFSHGGAWGQPSWSPVSSGGGEAPTLGQACSELLNT